MNGHLKQRRNNCDVYYCTSKIDIIERQHFNFRLIKDKFQLTVCFKLFNVNSQYKIIYFVQFK